MAIEFVIVSRADYIRLGISDSFEVRGITKETIVKCSNCGRNNSSRQYCNTCRVKITNTLGYVISGYTLMGCFDNILVYCDLQKATYTDTVSGLEDDEFIELILSRRQVEPN